MILAVVYCNILALTRYQCDQDQSVVVTVMFFLLLVRYDDVRLRFIVILFNVMDKILKRL